jgi:hypothetical protein
MAEGRHALIIANYQYNDPGLSKLIAPPQDAAKLTQVLEDPKLGGFTVKLLLNEYSYKVMEEIQEFFAEKGPDDLLLLYFSGHGIKDDEGHLFYAFPNTRINMVQATALEPISSTG